MTIFDDNFWWQFLMTSFEDNFFGLIFNLWLVIFETLIRILTIENLVSWQSLLPDNWLWHWTAFAILAMFSSLQENYTWIWFFINRSVTFYLCYCSCWPAKKWVDVTGWQMVYFQNNSRVKSKWTSAKSRQKVTCPVSHMSSADPELLSSHLIWFLLLPLTSMLHLRCNVRCTMCLHVHYTLCNAHCALCNVH